MTLVRALVVTRVDCTAILSLRQCLCAPPGQIAVRAQRRRSADPLSNEVRTHQPVQPSTPSVNSTGCVFQREFDSGCVLLRFVAFMVQRRHTLLTVYGVLLMSTVAVIFTLPTLSRYSSVHYSRSTLSDRAFSVAVARAWKGLPSTPNGFNVTGYIPTRSVTFLISTY